MKELTTAESHTRRTVRERHREPLDVHLILRRQTAGGPEVLMSRRAGTVYAAGLWHLPSGHLDGPHEDVVTALLREAREETGVVIDASDARSAVIVHHRGPGGHSRTGFFFEVRRWQGDPRIAEPEVCDAMDWVRLDAIPAGTVAYCKAGLDAYAAGARLAVHFQQPGDEIAYDPAADRLHLVPGADADPSSRRLTPPVRDVVERALGQSGGRARGSGSDAHDPAPGPGPAERGDAVSRTWLPPEQYAEQLMKATGFACIHFTDEQDRPVQLHAPYSPAHPWQMAGGTMEPGERPWQTAVRECHGETGITVTGPPRLLAAVYGLPGDEWPFSTMGMIFDGGRLSEAQIRGITLDPEEHDEIRVLPLEAWRPLMPVQDFARLTAVTEARRTGTAGYFDTWDWGET